MAIVTTLCVHTYSVLQHIRRNVHAGCSNMLKLIIKNTILYVKTALADT